MTLAHSVVAGEGTEPDHSQESEALQKETDRPIIFQVRGQRHNRRPSERNYSGRVHLPDDRPAYRRHVRGGSPRLYYTHYGAGDDSGGDSELSVWTNLQIDRR